MHPSSSSRVARRRLAALTRCWRLPLPAARKFATTPLAQVDFDTVVIGAGAVGLAVAERLSRSSKSLLVLEQHASFGTETSSRNSEVIHAGIYYPPSSLKTKLCIRGKDLLYDFCARHHIPHRRIGKWIVASTDDQLHGLAEINARATAVGVPTEFLSLAEAQRLEPRLIARGVLSSPTTGIIDSHAYMARLESMLSARGVDLAYRSRVSSLSRSPSGVFSIATADAPTFHITAQRVINCAGLYADDVARFLDSSFPDRIAPCKGTYYAYTGQLPLLSRLIYPVPEKNLKGLGVHATLDLSGKCKFGPDAVYVDRKDDLVPRDDKATRARFARAIGQYLSNITAEDLSVDYSGMRPKLSGPDEPARDFLIEQHYPGFVNLVGIESPGLTASLAIAEYVESMLEKGV
ncbi:hypothetical protein HDU87_002902 [Geranomyces variabilis]|uniref:L-2-hydroxyglutarate dehydrogenase, mitochondrial n=1 Tax=Geranomyces variabilis TaxID=109894 RepID=A0AAD5XMY0_9FUNG|nr:hypothetical protein HDU87_002902 [Geranomyces variabilis]